MGIITDRAKWGSKVTIYPFTIPKKSYKKEKAIHIELDRTMIIVGIRILQRNRRDCEWGKRIITNK